MESKPLNISQLFDTPKESSDAVLSAKHTAGLSPATIKRLREFALASHVSLVTKRPMETPVDAMFMLGDIETDSNKLRLEILKRRVNNDQSPLYVISAEDIHATLQQMTQKPNLALGLLLSEIDSLGPMTFTRHHGRSPWMEAQIDWDSYLCGRNRKKADWRPRQQEHAQRFGKRPENAAPVSNLLSKLIGKL